MDVRSGVAAVREWNEQPATAEPAWAEFSEAGGADDYEQPLVPMPFQPQGPSIDTDHADDVASSEAAAANAGRCIAPTGTEHDISVIVALKGIAGNRPLTINGAVEALNAAGKVMANGRVWYSEALKKLVCRCGYDSIMALLAKGDDDGPTDAMGHDATVIAALRSINKTHSITTVGAATVALNEAGITTARGSKWYPQTLEKVLVRCGFVSIGDVLADTTDDNDAPIDPPPAASAPTPAAPHIDQAAPPISAPSSYRGWSDGHVSCWVDAGRRMISIGEFHYPVFRAGTMEHDGNRFVYVLAGSGDAMCLRPVVALPKDAPDDPWAVDEDDSDNDPTEPPPGASAPKPTPPADITAGSPATAPTPYPHSDAVRRAAAEHHPDLVVVLEPDEAGVIMGTIDAAVCDAYRTEERCDGIRNGRNWPVTVEFTADDTAPRMGVTVVGRTKAFGDFGLSGIATTEWDGGATRLRATVSGTTFLNALQQLAAGPKGKIRNRGVKSTGSNIDITKAVGVTILASSEGINIVSDAGNSVWLVNERLVIERGVKVPEPAYRWAAAAP